MLTLGLVAGLLVRTVPYGHAGRLLGGVTQIRGSPVAHMGLGGLELANLVDAGAFARVGNEPSTSEVELR